MMNTTNASVAKRKIQPPPPSSSSSKPPSTTTTTSAVRGRTPTNSNSTSTATSAAAAPTAASARGAPATTITTSGKKRSSATITTATATPCQKINKATTTTTIKKKNPLVYLLNTSNTRYHIVRDAAIRLRHEAAVSIEGGWAIEDDGRKDVPRYYWKRSDCLQKPMPPLAPPPASFPSPPTKTQLWAEEVTINPNLTKHSFGHFAALRVKRYQYERQQRRQQRQLCDDHDADDGSDDETDSDYDEGQGMTVAQYQYVLKKHGGAGLYVPAKHCSVFWIDLSVLPAKVGSLRGWQRLNHFPEMHLIARKVNLFQRLCKIQRQFSPSSSFSSFSSCSNTTSNCNNNNNIFPACYFDFFPQSWSSRSERKALEDFVIQLQIAKKPRTFLMKPNNGCQGRGIILTRNPVAEMKGGGGGGSGSGGGKSASSPSSSSASAFDPLQDYTIQLYVHRPLLIEGRKFDMRVYVLVTSLNNPMPHIFVHSQGLVRIASQLYSKPTPANFKKTTMHLTNYAVNKKEVKESLSSGGGGGMSAATKTKRRVDGDGDGGEDETFSENDDDDAECEEADNSKGVAKKEKEKNNNGGPRRRSADADDSKGDVGLKRDFVFLEKFVDEHCQHWVQKKKPTVKKGGSAGESNAKQKQQPLKHAGSGEKEACDDDDVDDADDDNDGGDDDDGEGNNRQRQTGSPSFFPFSDAGPPPCEGITPYTQLLQRIDRAVTLTILSALPELQKTMGSAAVGYLTPGNVFSNAANANGNTANCADNNSNSSANNFSSSSSPPPLNVQQLGSRAPLADGRQCFELLGFDILVTENGRIHVLEVNHSPSLFCETALDQRIKEKVLADVFTLLQPTLLDAGKSAPGKSGGGDERYAKYYTNLYFNTLAAGSKMYGGGGGVGGGGSNSNGGTVPSGGKASSTAATTRGSNTNDSGDDDDDDDDNSGGEGAKGMTTSASAASSAAARKSQTAKESSNKNGKESKEEIQLKLRRKIAASYGKVAFRQVHPVPNSISAAEYERGYGLGGAGPMLFHRSNASPTALIYTAPLPQPHHSPSATTAASNATDAATAAAVDTSVVHGFNPFNDADVHARIDAMERMFGLESSARGSSGVRGSGGEGSTSQQANKYLFSAPPCAYHHLSSSSSSSSSLTAVASTSAPTTSTPTSNHFYSIFATEEEREGVLRRVEARKQRQIQLLGPFSCYDGFSDVHDVAFRDDSRGNIFCFHSTSPPPTAVPSSSKSVARPSQGNSNEDEDEDETEEEDEQQQQKQRRSPPPPPPNRHPPSTAFLSRRHQQLYRRNSPYCHPAWGKAYALWCRSVYDTVMVGLGVWGGYGEPRAYQYVHVGGGGGIAGGGINQSSSLSPAATTTRNEQQHHPLLPPTPPPPSSSGAAAPPFSTSSSSSVLPARRPSSSSATSSSSSLHQQRVLTATTTMTLNAAAVNTSNIVGNNNTGSVSSCTNNNGRNTPRGSAFAAVMMRNNSNNNNHSLTNANHHRTSNDNGTDTAMDTAAVASGGDGGAAHQQQQPHIQRRASSSSSSSFSRPPSAAQHNYIHNDIGIVNSTTTNTNSATEIRAQPAPTISLRPTMSLMRGGRTTVTDASSSSSVPRRGLGSAGGRRNIGGGAI